VMENPRFLFLKDGMGKACDVKGYCSFFKALSQLSLSYICDRLIPYDNLTSEGFHDIDLSLSYWNYLIVFPICFHVYSEAL